MDINPSDIRVDYFRRKNQGNWLDQTPQGVQITYLPTYKKFQCELYKSSHKNLKQCYIDLELYLKNDVKQDDTLTSTTMNKILLAINSNSHLNLSKEEVNSLNRVKHIFNQFK